MIKSSGIALVFFIGMVILGLFVSNALLILGFIIKGGSIETLLISSEILIESMDTPELLVSQLSSQVFSLIIPSFLYTKLYPEIRTQINYHSFKSEHFWLYLVFFTSCIPLVGLGAYINQLIPLPEWAVSTESRMNEFIIKMLDFKTALDLIPAIIVIAAIPAISEEWVFRGILQNQLTKWTKNNWISILLGALIFSAIHMQFEGFIPRFILGIALGYIYMISGNLWHSILLHFINNGFQVISAYFYKDEIVKQLENKTELPNLIVVSVSILIVVLLIIVFNNKFNFTKNVET